MLVDKIKLETDENIIKQTRRHWFVLASKLAVFAVAAVAPAIVMILINFLLPDYAIGIFVYGTLISFGYSLWLLLLWIGMFNVWTNYYLDLLIITDRRVIVIDQKGFFSRYVASFRLERMQDINIEINGLIATLLDYGTLDVETAGHGDAEFRVTGMPDPRALKAAILRASDGRIATNKSKSVSDGL